MFKAQGIDAVILKDSIDQPFITQLESKNEGVKFKRIDDELNDSFTEELSEDEEKSLKENRVEFENIEKYGTPRRLTFVINNICDKQSDLEEELKEIKRILEEKLNRRDDNK